MFVSELMNELVGIVFRGDEVPGHSLLAGASSDSRSIGPGELFIALPGTRNRGVDFLPGVFAAGCVAALVPHDASIPRPLAERCIGVKHIRRNAALAACAIYAHPAERLLTVGVTGTNGKTSTCYILKHMLEAAGHRVLTITTVAHEFEGWRRETPNTTPDAALLQSVLAQAVRDGATAAVLEVSAHGVLLDRVTGCRFDGMVFTNLSTDHQDFFDGIEPYFEEKMRLFTDAAYHKPDCVAAIGTGDAYGRRARERCLLPACSFSDDPGNGGAHIDISTLTVSKHGIEGHLRIDGRDYPVATTLTSTFNRANLAGAAGLAWMVGVPATVIERGLAGPIVVPGRLMPVVSRAPFRVIVDFAHTDSAMFNLLSGLRNECDGRLIVVFGAGGDKDPARRYTLPKVVIEWADIGVITLDNPRSEKPETIIETMVRNWHQLAGQQQDSPDLLVEPDRRRAVALALEQARTGDIVVLAGKGHETTQIYPDRVEHHDDRAVAAQWLAQHYGETTPERNPA